MSSIEPQIPLSSAERRFADHLDRVHTGGPLSPTALDMIDCTPYELALQKDSLAAQKRALGKLAAVEASSGTEGAEWSGKIAECKKSLAEKRTVHGAALDREVTGVNYTAG